MAINLWKLGGRPTAYNPFTNALYPGGAGYASVYLTIGIGSYTMRITALSPSSARLRVTDAGSDDVVVDWQLSPMYQTFEVSFFSKNVQSLFVQDYLDRRDDIIISDVKFVQTPLPKNTINGVDGFLSGKWVIHPNATVLDDATIVLNANGSLFEHSTLDIPVSNLTPGASYVFSTGANGESYLVRGYNASDVVILDSTFITTNSPYSFTLPSTTSYLRIYLTNSVNPTGRFIFSKPMLNLGSIQAPYARKNGNKMVMPTGKNLLPDFRSGKWTLDPVFTVNSANKVTGVFPDTNPYLATCTGIPVTAGATYTISGNFNTSFGRIRVSKGSDDTIIGGVGSGGITRLAFTVPAGETKINIRVDNNNNSAWVSGNCSWDSLQLEAGGVQTTFKPYYMKVNPKPVRVNSANKGMAFNGSTDLIDMGSNNLGITNNIVLDVDFFVTGYSGAGAFIFGKESEFKLDVINSQSAIRFLTGENWVGSILQVNIIANQRNTVKAVYDGTNKYIYVNGVLAGSIATSGNIPYVSTTFLTIGARKSAGGASISDYTQGIIYSAKLTINGVVAANYDLTEQNNFVGNQVIPGAQNLIPSFDDPRWVINSNAKIMGKDTLHLDATANNQTNYIDIPCQPNTTYLITSIKNDAYFTASSLDVNSNVTWLNEIFKQTSLSRTFTTPSNAVKLRMNCHNYTLGSGPYEWFKPQLYQLTGLEGTINGMPVQRNKASKRNLYAKR